jgi:hypothetical protein
MKGTFVGENNSDFISMFIAVEHNKLLLNSTVNATCSGIYRPSTGNKVHNLKHECVHRNVACRTANNTSQRTGENVSRYPWAKR